MALVEVDHVSKQYVSAGRAVQAIRDVSLAVEPGETLAVIGESGCGKSTLGRLVLGLERPDGGEIRIDGSALGSLSKREMRKLRSRMSVVFQEPFESLNPRRSVGDIIGEPLAIHFAEMSSAQRRKRVDEALEQVALNPTLRSAFPGELSGGQQQRVGIARAIVTQPSLIVLDEPTSSLDVSVQAQVVQLLQQLQHDLQLAYLFISHDIHTVEYISDRIVVMYLGAIMESGLTDRVIDQPQHPYTRALLSAKLSVDPRERLPALEVRGDMPPAGEAPEGCLFFPRCTFRQDPRCETERPPLRQVAPNHYAATFYSLPATVGSFSHAANPAAETP